MTYLHIKNWQEWQSYRTDRGTPPWIKVHRCLLSNQEWATLTDAEKDTIEKIRLLLIKELEKGTKEKKNSTSFNEILNLLNSIITRGGAIYSTA